MHPPTQSATNPLTRPRPAHLLTHSLIHAPLTHPLFPLTQSINHRPLTHLFTPSAPPTYASIHSSAHSTHPPIHPPTHSSAHSPPPTHPPWPYILGKDGEGAVLPPLDGVLEVRASVAVPGVPLRARLQDRSHEARRVGPDGVVERPVGALVLRLDVRVAPQQEGHRFGVLVLDGEVERRPP